jgi:hypothetical protein
MIEHKYFPEDYKKLGQFLASRQWIKLAVLADDLYRRLYEKFTSATNSREIDYLSNEMADMHFLCDNAEVELEKNHINLDSREGIEKVVFDMTDCFRNSDFGTALALNDCAYESLFEHYKTAKTDQQREEIAQKLNHLLSCQDVILFQTMPKDPDFRSRQ